MPKQEPTPSATNQTVVELSKVKFPSQTDSFRARLAKTDDECREDEAGDDGFAKLSVEYEFELTPLDVATTDIFAAKIRDLQENVKA
ncbi:hypothetical protein DYB34_010298, partial [Aphanomyces astaci]